MASMKVSPLTKFVLFHCQLNCLIWIISKSAPLLFNLDSRITYCFYIIFCLSSLKNYLLDFHPFLTRIKSLIFAFIALTFKPKFFQQNLASIWICAEISTSQGWHVGDGQLFTTPKRHSLNEVKTQATCLFVCICRLTNS